MQFVYLFIYYYYIIYLYNTKQHITNQMELHNIEYYAAGQNATQCSALQCNAMQRNAMQYIGRTSSTSTATTVTNTILQFNELSNKMHTNRSAIGSGSGDESQIPNSLKTTRDWTSQTSSLVALQADRFPCPWAIMIIDQI